MSIERNFRELISYLPVEDHVICVMLKPFYAVSLEMSSHMCTLAQVIQMIHILNWKINMLFEEMMSIGTMLMPLKEAMASGLSATLHNPRYIFATLLDSHYKAFLFCKEEAE